MSNPEWTHNEKLRILEEELENLFKKARKLMGSVRGELADSTKGRSPEWLTDEEYKDLPVRARAMCLPEWLEHTSIYKIKDLQWLLKSFARARR